ncbi:hypothetical protein BCR41DRAFT_374489 [Lobosporangium transversale]|uniref:Uncharacterized protein n=1 Tax=Lobosporangium transversale TaxID=64571 RepID=A0A1Y2GA50_9FUNG|nr:hypothetical protein BCR41DRAFT_374489 [Lobosporangium transversale]ORZ05295.1 hypothetical protein BCR41DRAFT_374489 [Lobosporangium transversale]|eukprot:XP_021876987.1 hypothetical protein BCR41DRAFT_374489 [Lobosporangium transversale]
MDNTVIDTDKDDVYSKRRSSMNPLAATFTPTFPKPTLLDCAASDHDSDVGPSSEVCISDSRESLVNGLGISSPSASITSGQQSQHNLTEALSPTALLRQDRPIFTNASPMTTTTASMSTTNTTTTTTAEFDPEEFRISLMRQISDKFSTLPLSPTVLDQNGSPVSNSGSNNGNGNSNTHALETTIIQLKKTLRATNTELDRLKDKNQELLEKNHKLELQHLEATHQVARLQDFELNNQFLLSRVKELESSTGSSLDSALETASMSGRRQNSTSIAQSQNQQQIQKLLREIAALTQERDALKIRSWELEKKPFAHQHQHEVRSAHFIDLENERNRLIEELGQKTVAMEDLWNKNEALTLRAKEYEKRVWELEGQVAALEADCASLPLIRSELVEMEARAEAADALVEKLQDFEGQVALVKTLQERINELETTNAELEHSNRDLSEKLNFANNQHTLLAKEFESFRSKDKDDRRLEYLVSRNRELETLLAEQSKLSPDYKEDYEKLSAEMEKLKLRVPQLEGQAKQAALWRNKSLQLEKQIKTMEENEPRLGEMQQLHERNMFLEGELGELEQLRARALELEHELEGAKARLIQLETNKSRMNSVSGLKLQSRARSGSVAQHGPPNLQPQLQLLQQQQQQQQQAPLAPQLQTQTQPSEENEAEKAAAVNLRIKTAGNTLSHHLTRSSSQSISSMDGVLSSPRSPKREFPAATVMVGGTPTPTTATWPSGRMSMSNSSHRMSTSSSTSTATVVSNTGSPGQHLKSLQHGYSAPVSPDESEEEMDYCKKEANAATSATDGATISGAMLTEEPKSLPITSEVN